MKPSFPRVTGQSARPGADLENKLLPPLIVAALGAMISLFVCLFLLSFRADRIAQARDQSLAAIAIGDWAQGVNAGLAAESAWDDSVAHVANRLDPDWIEHNLDSWFNHSLGLDQMAIIDARGRIIYAGRNGRRAPAASLAAYGRAVQPLIDQVRRAERARGALRRPDSVHRVAAPIQASRFVSVDGRPQLLSANLVEPDFGSVLPASPGPAPILLGIRTFDAQAVSRIAHKLILNGARVGPADQRPDRQTNAVAIALGGAQPAGTFLWDSRRPGTAIGRAALPVVLLACLVMLIGGAWLVRRTQRLTRGLVASQAHALHVALHDAFTGLANRALFEDRLDQALERRRRFGGSVGVFIIDLDRFKTVNDTLGHASGDQLIKEAARRIRKVCRNTDTVARFGGDEFAVVQSDAASGADVKALAGRLNQELSGPVELIGGATVLGASIGVAVIDTGEVDSAEALRRADLALYRAKDQGRARHVVFVGEMDESARLRQQLVTELTAALDSGAIEVAYQPQLTPRGRQIEAVEALARWRHPKLGQIAPDVFIPIAEEGELIDRIGLYVLKRACIDSRRWPGVVTAVNVSVAQLRRDGMVEAYLEVVEQAGCAPAMIELELTETVLLENDERTIRTLGRLKAAGFRLALDDFGVGHSSLNYLRLYPLDKIKIDRSYVTPLGVNSGDEAMVVAIVRLARAFGMAVTGEGVETKQQLDVLSRAGVSLVQGFLFSPAVSAVEIERMLAPGGGRLAA